MVKRVLQYNNVPGTSAVTRAASAQGPSPAGSAAGFLGENQFNGSLPYQTRFEQHQEGPGCLKSWGGDKDEMASIQGHYAPTETMVAAGKS